MLVMDCEVVIGQVVFTHVHSVEIDSTWRNLTDYCTIVLSKKMKVQGRDGKRQPVVSVIKVGQEVSVKLGYDGQLNQEFKGFVSGITAKERLEISCQDYMWLLKRQRVYGIGLSNLQLREGIEGLLRLGAKEESRFPAPNLVANQRALNELNQFEQVFKNPELIGLYDGRNRLSDGKLEEVLEVSPGLNPVFQQKPEERAEMEKVYDARLKNIKLAGNPASWAYLFPPGFGYIRNKTMAEILEDLKKDWNIYLWFRGDELHVSLLGGATYDLDSRNAPFHRYLVNWNIISHDLKYEEAADAKLTVNVYGDFDKETQRRVLGRAGTTQGLVKKVYAGKMGMTQADLTVLAENLRRNLAYDGLRGEFESFGAPYAKHGDFAILLDRSGELAGAYQISAVKTSFSDRGFRRRVTLGPLADALV